MRVHFPLFCAPTDEKILLEILCIPGIQYTDLKTIMESDPGADGEWSNLIDFKSITILYSFSFYFFW
jgi:hypothetical protein